MAVVELDAQVVAIYKFKVYHIMQRMIQVDFVLSHGDKASK